MKSTNSAKFNDLCTQNKRGENVERKLLTKTGKKNKENIRNQHNVEHGLLKNRGEDLSSVYYFVFLFCD